MEHKNTKKNKAKFVSEQRGAVLAITLGLCAAPAVGIFFLVRSLTDSASEQIPSAPSLYSDYGSSLPGISSEEKNNSVPSPSSSTSIPYTGTLNSGGSDAEPKPNDHITPPDTNSDYAVTIPSEASDIDAGSRSPAVSAAPETHTTKAAVTTVPQTAATPQTTTARTTGSTASTARATTTASSVSTSSYYFFGDVPDLEYDPEPVEGVIGDFFS